jgi:hypothetical protein
VFDVLPSLLLHSHGYLFVSPVHSSLSQTPFSKLHLRRSPMLALGLHVFSVLPSWLLHSQGYLFVRPVHSSVLHISSPFASGIHFWPKEHSPRTSPSLVSQLHLSCMIFWTLRRQVGIFLGKIIAFALPQAILSALCINSEGNARSVFFMLWMICSRAPGDFSTCGILVQ